MSKKRRSSSSKKLYSSKKNDKQSNEHSSKVLDLIFCVIIPIFISLIISEPFKDWFYKFQISKLSNYNKILFIHDSISSWIMMVSPGIIILLIILVIRNNLGTKLNKLIICLIGIITILIISTSILFMGFFHYTVICNDVIHVRSSIFSNIVDYNWSDVQDVKVSYKRGSRQAILISYDIQLKDGKTINAHESTDFFDNIIDLDNMIQSKNIVINRQKIASNDYNGFVKKFQNAGSAKTDKLEVVLKIFDK